VRGLEGRSVGEIGSALTGVSTAEGGGDVFRRVVEEGLLEKTSEGERTEAAIGPEVDIGCLATRLGLRMRDGECRSGRAGYMVSAYS
jgi:hypothetical protein